MTKTRINPTGVQFTLTSQGDKTLAKARGKELLLDLPLDELMQCWYNWQMKDELIQVAFSKLPANQREFLMTTITPTEWKEIFEGHRDVSY